MKNNIKYLGFLTAAAIGVLAQSCAMDEPFGNSDGEGVLQMKLVVNSDVTRAEYDEAQLASNCVVYISGQQGLLHKYQGIENVPDKINLKNGHYVAEAWTGDSVSASFDSKFFRGYQPFDINGGLENVVLKCRIANVVVSINSNTVNDLMMSGWNVNVGHSRGSLDFTSENMDYAKGYFMMPNSDKDLTVTVTGKNAEGKDFTKVQTIPDVERAHEYVLNFAYNPEASDPTDGGAFLTITIDDSEVLVEDEVEIYGRPAVTGVEFDLSRQIIGNEGAFNDMYIKVNCFGGMEHFYLRSDDYLAMNLPSSDIDLCNATEQVKQSVTDAGLVWEADFKAESNLLSGYLTLSKKWLNALVERDAEYALNATIIDKYGKSADFAIRVAVGEGAVVIDDPVTVDDAPTDDLMAILSTRATLTGSLVNADAVNPGIRYRESGTGTWTFVAAGESVQRSARRKNLTPAQAVRSGGTQFTVTLTGLKAGTRYEYQACADGFNSTSKFFTTEGTFDIPNGGLEIWGTYRDKAPILNITKTIVIPGDAGNQEDSFWSTGNQGSSAANTTLTDKTTSMVHSGQYAAELQTKEVMTVIAAGNMFSGIFSGVEDGTNGILTLGREFNGTHPTSVRLWANYRPGTNCTVSSDNKNFVDIVSGGTDHGQIYVALASSTVEVHTSSLNRQLVTPDRSEIIAYGQVTWTGNFGADGTLEKVEIPFEYNAKAKYTRPTHLIIVCAASKFGDYFSGAKGSTMVVDDFELVYE